MHSADRIRALIISPDEPLSEGLSRALEPFGDRIVVAAVLPGYPSATELNRILRAQMPTAIFLSFARPDLAVRVIEMIEAEAQGLPVVAFHAESSTGLLRESLRAGTRDFLVPPFTRQTLSRTIQNLEALLQTAPPEFDATSRIYSFLPAKPGAGTSVVAMNTAAALGRQASGRVLLSDLDLACGILRFLWKVRNQYSVVDAAARSAELDDESWPQLVVPRGEVDLIESGGMNPQAFIDPEGLRGVINFARRRYAAICLDHSGNFERYSIEAMDDSREIFLVCTPEAASIAIARERLALLAARRLTTRVSLVLNRARPESPERNRIEDALGMPVAAVIPNDYRAVSRAIHAGEPLPRDSQPGQGIEAFAARLLGRELEPSPLGSKWLRWFRRDSAQQAPCARAGVESIPASS